MPATSAFPVHSTVMSRGMSHHAVGGAVALCMSVGGFLAAAAVSAGIPCLDRTGTRGTPRTYVLGV